jgi:hypothetical protein
MTSHELPGGLALASPSRRTRRTSAALLLAAAAAAWPAAAACAADLQVVLFSPARTAAAPVTSAISASFDRPLDPSSITATSFRVLGRISGRAAGSFAFSADHRTVTLTPAHPFSAGEVVLVNIAGSVRAADGTRLRRGGHAWQFATRAQPSTGEFAQIDSLSNRTHPVTQTRIYGAAAGDLDGDRYPDLATVNEVSGDVRVFLNRGDASGLYDRTFLPPVAIGFEASPSETADFNNDGKLDLAVAATGTDSAWILLGDGRGGFSSVQSVAVGGEPHGIAVLDADGDADLDVATANHGSDNLSLSLNDGNGVFGPASFFDSGADGEYGLAAGDMDNDGITDLVVAARDGQQVISLLGSGDGGFTPSAPQASGGLTWVLVVGDVDGDGNLDAATANSTTGNGAVLLGNGDGTFDPPDIVHIGAHVPATDLGDLDGDGDLDLVLSSYGGGFWRIYDNDGGGGFTLAEQIEAPSNPSCALLYDADNDGDLDLALSDEIADVVLLFENLDATLCSPTALPACRVPTAGRRSVVVVRNRDDDARDVLAWKWARGQATTKADFGAPLAGEDYELCFYANGALFYGARVPAEPACALPPCWRETGDGYLFRNRNLLPSGARVLRLKEGARDGTTKLRLAGRGGALDLPDFRQLGGTLEVQLQKSSGPPCWSATFTPPFLINDGVTFRAKAD